MKALAHGKTMTLKEIAEITGAAYRTIANYARKAGWTENGKTTHLTEAQVTMILEAIKKPVSSGAKSNLLNEIEGIATSQSRVTVKEVARILNVSIEVIQKHIRLLYPDLMKNGVTTYLNEEQVTRIKQAIEPRTLIRGGADVLTDIEADELAVKLLSHYKAKNELWKRKALEQEGRAVRAETKLLEVQSILNHRTAGLETYQRIAESEGFMLSDFDDLRLTYRQ